MVETVEYIIGFAITTGIAVFSIFVLSGAGPILGQFVSNASQVRVVDAARHAVSQNMTESVSLNLSGTSILCSHGVMTVSSSSGDYSSEVGSDCGFRVSGISGMHELTFAFDGQELRARVSR